jgi:menaquinone-specific isochorismate synthase
VKAGDSSSSVKPAWIEPANAGWLRAADATIRTALQQAVLHNGISSATVDMTFASPTVLADALPSQPRVLWRARNGGVIAGIGAAVTLRAGLDHGDRFASIAAQAKQIRWHTDDTKSTSRFYGGFSFANGSADNDTWRGFGDAWFILPRWIFDGGSLTLHVSGEQLQSDPSLADTLLREFSVLRDMIGRPTITIASGPSSTPWLREANGNDKPTWQSNVSDIVAKIHAGAASKIVAARSVNVSTSRHHQLSTLLETLWAQQPHCFGIAMSPGGEAATFVAVPPERLVEKKDTQVSSEALAGSLPNDGSIADRAVLLDDVKNMAEHRWVIDAVASGLASAGVELATQRETTVRSFRNIHHLHTPITGTLRKHRHVLELIAALHPTPAVGGTPRSEALQWIAEHETPRGYYASPVGWFSVNGDGEFAVAIRCALFRDHRATLWAGAGIVAASDWDVEFAETETKLQTMLGALATVVGEPAPR